MNFPLGTNATPYGNSDLTMGSLVPPGYPGLSHLSSGFHGHPYAFGAGWNDGSGDGNGKQANQLQHPSLANSSNGSTNNGATNDALASFGQMATPSAGGQAISPVNTTSTTGRSLAAGASSRAGDGAIRHQNGQFEDETGHASGKEDKMEESQESGSGVSVPVSSGERF